MYGLGPILFLAKQASLMPTINFWPEVGLCNGATGKVVDIIFAENHSPPDLPIAVMVQFEHYTGPSFTELLPKCVPVCPITVFMNDSQRERAEAMMYVTISRIRPLDSCVIEPMSFERLKTIKNASSFQLRMHLAKKKSAFVVWQIIQH